MNISLLSSGAPFFLSSNCRFLCSILEILCGIWTVTASQSPALGSPFLRTYINISSSWVHFRTFSLLYLHSLKRRPPLGPWLSIYTIYTLMTPQLTSPAGTFPWAPDPYIRWCPLNMWSSSLTNNMPKLNICSYPSNLLYLPLSPFQLTVTPFFQLWRTKVLGSPLIHFFLPHTIFNPLRNSIDFTFKSNLEPSHFSTLLLFPPGSKSW